MNTLRPIVPSRGAEIICFAVGGFTALAFLAYLIFAHSRGLIELLDIFIYWLFVVVGASPTFILGLLFRRHRLRKLAAFDEYQRVLRLGSTTV